MIIHLIRHPRPLIEPGICYGQLDVDCENPEPIAQRLRGILPKAVPVYSSPLKRCVNLAKLLDSSFLIDDRLMEIDFGNWEGRPWADIPRSEIDAWSENVVDYQIPGGESARHLLARVCAFLNEKKLPEIVLVTHAGVARLLGSLDKNKKITGDISPSPEYGAILRIEYALD